MTLDRSEVLFAREKWGTEMGRPPLWSAMEGLGANLNLDLFGQGEKEGGGWVSYLNKNAT